MLPAGNSAAGLSFGGLLKVLFLLALAGVAMRMTILAMPPVIPLVHRELHMSETQVGLLVGLPLALFAIAAVPGSLLIARVGTKLAVVAGMVIAALAGAARGAAFDIWTLYAAAIGTGLGVAIMQPAMPTLVREWLPNRIPLGTVVYSGGMLIGATCAPVFTIPYVLPLAGGSWRLNLVLWAIPAILIAPVFFLLSPESADRMAAAKAMPRRWWPDWRNPVIWLIGFALGSNNSPYFATNALLGDYLAAEGRSDLLGPALGWLNASQIPALLILLFASNRLQRRAWPFVLFGPLMLAAFIVLMVSSSTTGIIGAAAVVGFTGAMTFAPILALPALLSAQGDVPRTAAGMFTVSYSCAIVVPTVCGALWDTSGRPWTAFLPLCLCAVVLTVLGALAARHNPSTDGSGR
jgi:MFS transporter, CP family, cyanate transporter